MITLRAVVRYTTACAWLFVAIIPALARQTATSSARPIERSSHFWAQSIDFIADPVISFGMGIVAIVAFCFTQSAQNRTFRRLAFALFTGLTLALWAACVVVGDYPPAIAGFLSGIAVVILAVVAPRTPQSPDKNAHIANSSPAPIRSIDYDANRIRTDKRLEKHPLSIARYVVFYAIALAGFAIIAFRAQTQDQDQAQAHVIALTVSWLCIALLAANAILWPFAQIPEWLGYAERRRCFIDRKPMKRRKLAIVLATIACIAAIALAL